MIRRKPDVALTPVMKGPSVKRTYHPARLQPPYSLSSLRPDGWTYVVCGGMCQDWLNTIVTMWYVGWEERTDRFQQVLTLDNCAYVVATAQHTHAWGQRGPSFSWSFLLLVLHDEKSCFFFLFPVFYFSILFLPWPVLFYYSFSFFCPFPSFSSPLIPVFFPFSFCSISLFPFLP